MCSQAAFAVHHHLGRAAVRGLLGRTASGLALFAALACSGALADGPSLDPANMPRVGTVEERFQSYNIEMV